MISHAKVRFHTNNTLLQKLVDTAETKCLSNIKSFGGRKVLIEGGGYEKIWLETQPMGGEMYAKRNIEIGLNNQLLFMEHIRADGRLPGSIAMIDGVITPQFNKIQGFYFPAAALNMYYLSGKNKAYLELLYASLERFDAYLWKTRDSDQDGCLESFCKYDTGEDHAVRYKDAPDAWEEERPPSWCQIVPMASMDFMSFSYSARATLSEISALMQREAWAKEWKDKANLIKKKIRDYLWDEARGACFDRDKKHRIMPALIHNTLRTMYFQSIDQNMAESFTRRHILNPKEFWTKMPLPSVAVNDPIFRNIKTNDWSGQVEALTYQRAIRALENYGYDWLIPQLGNKLFEAIGENCVFVQQYDPFTMQPSSDLPDGEQDAYGPAMLSVLEYVARMYGIHIERDQIYWGAYGGSQCTYEQEWGDNCYRIESTGKQVEAYRNGKKLFSMSTGCKIVTDYDGKILYTTKLSGEKQDEI